MSQSTTVPIGCTKVSKVLNANNQEVTIWCTGQQKVGINIFSITGTNTFSFLGSQDGVNFSPISVATYPAALGGSAPGGWFGNLPSGNVTTTGAAGKFECNVSNYQFIRVQLTTGTGPATVLMAASADNSYQEAFNTPSNVGVSLATVFPSTTSSAGSNTMTIPAVANAAINLTYLEIAMVAPAPHGAAQLRIWDGAVNSGVPLYSCYLSPGTGSVGTSQLVNLPTDAQGNKGVQATPGNAMVCQIINLGNITAIMNARVSYQ